MGAVARLSPARMVPTPVAKMQSGCATTKPMLSGAYVSQQRRQKITQRAIRPEAARVTQENADIQAQQQREFYSRKQQEFAELEQKMLKKLNGTRDEQLELQAEERAFMDEHVRLREAQREQERAQDRAAELQMLQQIKYEEMLAKEKQLAEEEYKQYLAYQQEQEHTLRMQNKTIEKEMQKVEDAETLNKFFQQHFGKSIR